MYEVFKDEKAAQDKVDELNRTQPAEFCPLARETCRAHCVCFKKAQIHKRVLLDDNHDRVEEFWAYEGGCQNSMFFEG